MSEDENKHVVSVPAKRTFSELISPMQKTKQIKQQNICQIPAEKKVLAQSSKKEEAVKTEEVEKEES